MVEEDTTLIDVEDRNNGKKRKEKKEKKWPQHPINQKNEWGGAE
jgi:hypothetical protein